MHSVVWQYIAAEEQADISAQMQAAGIQVDAAPPLAWLRFKTPAPDQAVERSCRVWRGSADTGPTGCSPAGTRTAAGSTGS